MAKEFIYQMQGLEKRAPNGKTILDGIWLSFFPGAKIGVIGPNGAGKSTLLRIMAGIDEEYTGETWIDPEAKVGYLPQEPELNPELDVRGNVEEGLGEVRDLLKEFEEVSAQFAEVDPDEMNKLIEKQARLQDQIEAVNGWDLERTLDIAMDALRLPPGDQSVDVLSGGEKRRVALCKLLLAKPDLLLLDEPTNHLDAETVAWLERTLREYEGTVIVVTHDRYFLDNITKWILELESGKGIPFEGNYSSWLEQKQERLRQQEKQASARAKALENELDWIRMGQSARQAKSKARINRYQELHKEHLASQGQRRKREIVIPEGSRLGDVVVRAKDIRKGFGDRLLIEDLTFSLPPGGIVGVIGPNGAGKTTMFNMITGDDEPDEGTVEVGETVEISNVTQMRDELDPDETVWESISGRAETLEINGNEINSRAYVGAFGFKGTTQQQKVGTLSGGERNRVHLAKTLLAEGNLLLLDEPSNDLDVATLRALEVALEDFSGCAVIISHDRWFLDRIATHIMAFEGNSQVVWFEGNYEAYEEDRRRRLGVEADQPHRIKFKPLTR